MAVFSSRGMAHRQNKPQISMGSSHDAVPTSTHYRSHGLSMLCALLIGIVVPISDFVLTPGTAQYPQLKVQTLRSVVASPALDVLSG